MGVNMNFNVSVKEIMDAIKVQNSSRFSAMGKSTTKIVGLCRNSWIYDITKNSLAFTAVVQFLSLGLCLFVYMMCSRWYPDSHNMLQKCIFVTYMVFILVGATVIIDENINRQWFRPNVTMKINRNITWRVFRVVHCWTVGSLLVMTTIILHDYVLDANMITFWFTSSVLYLVWSVLGLMYCHPSVKSDVIFAHIFVDTSRMPGVEYEYIIDSRSGLSIILADKTEKVVNLHSWDITVIGDATLLMCCRKYRLSEVFLPEDYVGIKVTRVNGEEIIYRFIDKKWQLTEENTENL